MKTAFWTIAMGLIVGSLAGFGSAYVQYGLQPTYRFSRPFTPSRTDGPDVAATSPETADGQASPGIPHLRVEDSPVHDFGIMPLGTSGQHTFILRNIGDAPLTVDFIDKTCQCTDIQISRRIVPPGETTGVTLVWTPTKYKLDFSQTARFRTNDPRQFELDLRVKGRVQQIVQANPMAVSFGDLSTGSAGETVLDIVGFRDPDLAVTRVEWLEPETAKYFHAEIVPLTEHERTPYKGSQSGSRLRLRIEPGMPIGPVVQRVKVHLNQADLEPLMVPVQGNIVGKVNVYGAGFDTRTQVLKLGSVNGNGPTERQLWVLVKNQDGTAGELQVESVDPQGVLQAELGPPQQLGPVTKYPLTVRVQPADQAVNRLGGPTGPLGSIRLMTTGTNRQQAVIRVAFAVPASL